MESSREILLVKNKKKNAEEYIHGTWDKSQEGGNDGTGCQMKCREFLKKSSHGGRK